MTKEGSLSSVYFVPGLVANLFSISTTTKKGLTAKYTETSVEIWNERKCILSGPRSNGVYKLNLNVIIPDTACMAQTLERWHEAFGHVSMDVINRMSKAKCVTGLSISDVQRAKCDACVLGKCTNASHRLRSSAKATESGRVLHFDTVGFVNPPSLGRAKYFLLCRDEHSSYRQVAFVQTKAEITDHVKKMVNRAELEAMSTLKIVTDNGSEFVNNALKSFLDLKGVIHNKSVVYTPQQNGYIERDNRTVIECARTMLLKSKLSKVLWAEAVNTAVYVLNRSLNTRTIDKTPYELWHKKVPDVSNFHVFGDNMVIKSHRAETKWDSRGEVGKFVGYTDIFNTYRVFIPSKNSVVISCNVSLLSNTEDPTPEHVPIFVV